MIGQHPQLCGLPEVNLFAGDTYKHLARFYLLRENFQHGLLRAIAELGLGDQTADNIEVARSWLREDPSVSTASLFQDLVEWAAPRMPVDKSPIYVFEPEAFSRIHAAYPNARFIHLVRHPRGTCESVYKIRDNIQERIDNLPLDEASRQGLLERAAIFSSVKDADTIWLTPHKRILDFLAGIPDELQLRMRGEDLMSNPDEQLGRIAAWLGLRTDDEAIDAMKHPERSPFACTGPPNAKFGNDPNFLERPTLRTFVYKPLSLDDPLSVGEANYLSDETKEYARMFGY